MSLLQPLLRLYFTWKLLNSPSFSSLCLPEEECGGKGQGCAEKTHMSWGTAQRYNVTACAYHTQDALESTTVHGGRRI